MIRIPLESSERGRVTLREGSRVAGRFVLRGLIDDDPDGILFDADDTETSRVVRIRFRPRPSRRRQDAGIVEFVDQGKIGTYYAAVRDPGPGHMLVEALQGRQGLDQSELLAIGGTLLDALQRGHDRDRVHGNLSVLSIHIASDGAAQVVDWPEEPGGLGEAAALFASPERHNGGLGRAPADQYAVASILYSLGTGRPPFGVERTEARDGHLYGMVEADGQLSMELYGILERAMSKRPEDRFGSAAEFAVALRSLEAPASPEWVDTMDPAPRRRRVRPQEASRVDSAVSVAMMALLCAGFGAMAVVSLAAAGAMWWWVP